MIHFAGGKEFPMYTLSRWALKVGLLCVNRFATEGSENVPAAGGCIVAANHASYLDPPAMGAGVRHRMVQFMARDTLASSGFAHWLFTAVGCVLIDRQRGDVAALKRSLQVLKAGGVLGLFPEGTRSLDGELQQAKGGIGFLIAKAAVPVVPAYISGTNKAFPKHAKWIRPCKVGIRFGPPIQPAEFAAYGEKKEYDLIGKLVMERIAALKR